MSENLRSQLDLPQTLSPVPPSAEAAACIFPARAKVDVLSDVLWQPKCRRAQSTRHAASSSSAGAQPTVARSRTAGPSGFVSIWQEAPTHPHLGLTHATGGRDACGKHARRTDDLL